MRVAGTLTVLALACSGLAGCGGGGDGGKSASEPAPASKPAQAPKPPAELDTAKVESQLEKIVGSLSMPAVPATVYPNGGGTPTQSQVGGGRVKVRSVTCPDHIALEKGGTFTCDVEVKKATASVRLKQLDDAGAKLAYTTKIESKAAGGIPVVTRLHGRFKVE